MKEKIKITTSTINLVDNPTLIKTPNYVGGYRLGGKFGLQINFNYKPNWFQRTMMRLCFGWEWVNL